MVSYIFSHWCILLINSNESHSVEFLSNVTYDRICLHFRKDFVAGIDQTGFLLAPFENRPIGVANLIRPCKMESSLLKTLLDNLIEEVPNREVHITTTFLAILNELARNFVSLSVTKQFKSTKIGEIVQFINNNICDELSLDQICKQFYISKAQLLRIFKNELGTTVHNYIIVKRLAMAKQMLSLGNSPVNVYSHCGFTNYSVFYKAFKKYYGHTPSQPISTWQDNKTTEINHL